MARRTDLTKLQLIYRYIQQRPGIKPAEIARLLGMHRSAITRALVELETQNLLVSEDDRGGLWPFNRGT